MSTQASKQSGGVGCVGVLLIVFVVLKLTGNLAWSWLWVLSPLWVPTAAVATILGVVVLFALTAELRK